MSNVRNNTLAIVMLAALSSLTSGCLANDESAGTGQLRIYLINPPAHSNSVVLVVREVSVHSENQGWITVTSTPRTFELLKPSNGAQSVMGETALEAGRYTEIRVLFDKASHVVVGGGKRLPAIAGESGTGMTLAQQFHINPNTLNELYLDFDPSGSVCECECCKQYTAELHISGNPQTLGNNAERRLRASRGVDRCKCGDRWDHRRQSSQHCRHCAPISRSVGEIG